MKIVTSETLAKAIEQYFKIEDIRTKKRHRHLVHAKKVMYYLAKYKLDISLASIARYLNQGHGIESYHANQIHGKIMSGDFALEDDIHAILDSLFINKRKINFNTKYRYLFDQHETLKKTNKALRTDLLIEKQLSKKLKNELSCLRLSLLST